MTSTAIRRRRNTVATATFICLAAAAATACGTTTSTAASTANSETPSAVTVSSAETTTNSETESSETTTSDATITLAVAPESLTGTWLADSFITVGALRPIASDLGAGIRFDSGSTVEIDTGCSRGSATVTFVADDTISLSELALAPEGVCNDAAADVERRLLELFAHPLSWDVVQDQLKLLPTDSTDSGLILRSTVAADPADEPSDVSGLLAAAADARVRHTNGFDTPNVFSTVAIIDTYGIPADDGVLDALPGTVPISNESRRAVEAALGPITVQWVKSAADVPTEPTATWDEQPLPALLTLAEPVVDGTSAVVISDLRCGSGCVIGGGQQFDRGADGRWSLIGPVGTQWQS